MKIMVEHDRDMRFMAKCGRYVVATGKAEDDKHNNGMWPGQLFIAALGACIAGYVVAFCKRHNLAHEGMTVELDYESADSPSRATVANAVVNLPALVAAKYRRALIRTADQCYITQSIEHRMQVGVLLRDGAEQTTDQP